jgi:4-hydroxymandelate oxidase
MNVFDYEALAQQWMPAATWDYIQGGSEDEITLQANRSSFQQLRLRPRALNDVTTIDTRTSVQNTPVRMPIFVAPMGLHTLVCPEGECATAQAVQHMGSIMTVSTFATQSLEEIAQHTSAHLWLQLYLYQDLEFTQSLVRRAEAAGYQAIVLTVDAPYLGRRERDIRNKFTLPPSIHIANIASDTLPKEYIPVPAVATWKTVSWLRALTPLPIILKGILTAEDALIALHHQVNGIIVSNHGGRQLDGVQASIEALPEIVQAVNGCCEIYLDGGIRRGTDVLKALALGARAVFVGRPILWGLAVDGRQGVQAILELLLDELSSAMALSGYPTIARLDRALVK